MVARNVFSARDVKTFVETFSCCLAFRKQTRVVQQHIISQRAVVINENH